MRLPVPERVRELVQPAGVVQRVVPVQGDVGLGVVVEAGASLRGELERGHGEEWCGTGRGGVLDVGGVGDGCECVLGGHRCGGDEGVFECECIDQEEVLVVE